MDDRIMNWVQQLFKTSPELMLKALYSISIICIIWFIKRILIHIIHHRIEIKHLQTVYNWKKGITYLSYILGILLVGRIWFQGIQSLATFLGLLSAGLAIALKDLISNIAGWILILWQAPFSAGDRIQINATKGDVIDIGALYITLLEVDNSDMGGQSTGRLIQVPNATILNQHMVNESKGFHYIWNEIPILLTFNSNWQHAKDLLNQMIVEYCKDTEKKIERHYKQIKKRTMIHYSHLTPIVYTSAEASGILLTIRYLIHPRHRRKSIEDIWETILKMVEDDPQIELAYPTQHLFIQQTSAK